MSDNPAAARLARLRERVRGAGKSRGSVAQIERAAVIGGGLLLTLGLVFIFLGWYGAAHTPRLFEQIPYAVSGGIFGGALVVIGGFLYFGYWLTRIVHDGRRQTDQLTSAIGRLENQLASLAASAATSNGHTSHTSTSGAASRSRSGSTLVATATGTMIHRPDCPVVANRDGLIAVKGDTSAYKPCKICEPV